ncbi:calmodulin-like 3 [Lobosporangium transversale]|uniref:Calmodulin n=1 Tax=Lobosporangium transversale TaxID=64571 RepID=A0A1Y2GAF3_9FUNG|nr:calmodulin [Lobosporangium transversale]KAF9919371.1 calmodulin-like 3 [Lobosporangium transversale]ORZ05532.1 calmodulin [Lobosporangium transversale]|eukprot:XP_021877106.1 calmodulin [Lobosporangium transversale]
MSSLTEQQIACFQESFDAFDKNGDGAISPTELRSLLRVVGESYSKDAVENMIREFDTDNNRHIDFQEFLALASRLMKNKTA